jgi:hypothetical protein
MDAIRIDDYRPPRPSVWRRSRQLLAKLWRAALWFGYACILASMVGWALIWAATRVPECLLIVLLKIPFALRYVAWLSPGGWARLWAYTRPLVTAERLMLNGAACGIAGFLAYLVTGKAAWFGALALLALGLFMVAVPLGLREERG